jgi:pimeloyl-ACP methyl ester carboxylesterase
MKTVLHKGCSLSYQVQGDGPPLMMIQGVGVHGSGWRPQVDGLSAHYRCLWFDNRGIGLSQPASQNLTVEEMAGDALALMDAEGWESAHIIGHSLGGLIALYLGLNARNRVRSLSLLCTFSRGADATKLSPWMLWVGMQTRIGPLKHRRRAFLRIVMPEDVLARSDRDKLAADLAPIFGHDLGTHPAVVMPQLDAMRRYDATPRLSELKGIPTLVVIARHDRIARREVGKAMAAAIPGAQFIEFDDASHGAPIQCADRMNRMLLEHLQSSHARKSKGL